MAPLGEHGAQGAKHVGVDDPQDGECRFLHSHAQPVADPGHGVPRALDVELHLPAEEIVRVDAP